MAATTASDKDDDKDDDYDESLQAALADLELLQSAYPDEIDRDDESYCSSNNNKSCACSFPLTVTLRFSSTASCQLQWRAGYPTATGIAIAASRAKDSAEQQQLERALRAIRATSAACWEDGVEGGWACCAAAMEAWNDTNGGNEVNGENDEEDEPPSSVSHES